MGDFISTHKDPTPSYRRIDHFISVGDYKSAHNELIKIKPSEGVHYSEDFNYGGFAIDIGDGLADLDLIKEGIDHTRKALDQIPEERDEYASALFNLGSGLDSSFKQTHERIGYYAGHQDLEIIKSVYRKAISWGSSDPRPLVNYGNLLNGQLGRALEALEWYDKGIALVPDHALALANRGYAKYQMAKVVSKEAGLLILHEAYSNIQKSFEVGMDANPTKFFSQIASHIVSFYSDPSVLDEVIQCENALPEDKKDIQTFYTLFCYDHQLYLNPLGKRHSCEAAIGGYSGSFGQSFRKVSDTLFAPVQVELV